MEKNSYERHAYESHGNPPWVTHQKWTENKIQAIHGLTILAKILTLQIVRFLVLTQFHAAVMLIPNITIILSLVPSLWGKKL